MLRPSIAAAVLLLGSIAGCSNDTDADPAPDPPTTSPTSEAPPTPTSDPTVPAYLETYSTAERQAYAEASAAFDAYVARNAAFSEAGRPTARVRSFLQRRTTDWANQWARFTQLANAGVRIIGTPKTLRERPVRIRLGDSTGADTVVLRRCVDSSALSVTQHGKVVPQPRLRTPRFATVTMVRRLPESWWRSGTARQGSTC